MLVGLWRLATTHPEQAKMVGFLSNDFEIPRWREAALKNAYALLSKQRYEQAAAFFILGESPRNAVQVLRKNMRDIPLALLVARIFEGDSGPSVQELLLEHVVPQAIVSGDRWEASAAYWLAGKRDKALLSIVVRDAESLVTDAHLESAREADVFIGEGGKAQAATRSFTRRPFDSAMLLYYRHLVSLPSAAIDRAAKADTREDDARALCIRCAVSYDQMGAPVLALYHLNMADDGAHAEVEEADAAAPAAAPAQASNADSDSDDDMPLVTSMRALMGGPPRSSAAPAAKSMIDTGTFNFDDWGAAPTAAKPAAAVSSIFDASSGDSKQSSAADTAKDRTKAAAAKAGAECAREMVPLLRLQFASHLLLPISSLICRYQHTGEAYKELTYVTETLVPSVDSADMRASLERYCEQSEDTHAYCTLVRESDTMTQEDIQQRLMNFLSQRCNQMTAFGFRAVYDASDRLYARRLLLNLLAACYDHREQILGHVQAQPESEWAFLEMIQSLVVGRVLAALVLRERPALVAWLKGSKTALMFHPKQGRKEALTVLRNLSADEKIEQEEFPEGSDDEEDYSDDEEGTRESRAQGTISKLCMFCC